MAYVGYKPYINWRYPFKTMWEIVSDTPKVVRELFQRGYRGYADSDLWSFDGYLNKVIPPAISQFRDNLNGWPIEILEMAENDEDGMAIWAAILTDIADGFAAARKLSEMPYLDDYDGEVTFPGEGGLDEFGVWLDEHREEHKALEEEWRAEFEHGMKLFSEFYMGLWD